MTKAKKRTELSLKLSLRLRKLMRDEKRRKNNYTEDAFLKEIGINPRIWYRIIQRANPTFYTLCEIAEALKIHPMELLNFDMDERVKRINEYPYIIRSKPRKKKSTK